jgi:hypothetical protein
MYTQVAATPPNASAPTITPPMGFLWVDTSTTPPSGTAYYPPQTPPASGFNSFTDASGEVWISLNGSAWKKARDVLHVGVARNATFNIPTTAAAISYDTIVSDPYSIYNAGTTRFTLPIAGIYLVTAELTANMTTGQWVHQSVYKNGTNVADFSFNAFGAVWGTVPMAYSLKAIAGDYLQMFGVASAVIATIAGTIYTFCNVDYLGTG